MNSIKNILVVGAGAVGGYFGARLALAGAEVTFIARGGRLSAMQKGGLVLKRTDSAGGQREDRLKVFAAEKPDGKYDLIIISVKSMDTAAAAAIASGHLEEGGAVVSLQNGVENVDIIAENFPKESVIGGVVRSALSNDGFNTVSYISYPSVIIGAAFEEGRRHEAELKTLFTLAGIQILITDNIRAKQWEKLIWNIAFNPLSALTFATCGEMVKSERLSLIMRAVAEEAVQAALLCGVNLRKGAAQKALELDPAFNDFKTSTLQDVERNRKPEIEAIMLPVVRWAKEGKISAPFTECLYELLQFRHERWYHTFPRLAADVLAVNGDKLLLIERKHPPHGWAIPGGMVDYGESVESAAVREFFEETGIKKGERDITLLGVYSEPSRDKRGHTVSVVYYTFTDEAPIAADDAKSACYFPIDNLPPLVFDHKKVIEDYLAKTDGRRPDGR
ncbi:MAG: 2-dehydropantoate 2-reductase [Deferribacteraceae bacterium]|nr:2-dehydropantoate 2-reductase [Deferribacteraceae bacterium]